MNGILVTGGAGYIGSVTAKLFLEAGYKVYVLDNLSTGHKKYADGAEFLQVDTLDKDRLAKIMKDIQPDAVLHFAAKIQVEESMREPSDYLNNNVMGSINVIEAMLRSKVKNIVFSSTAAIYGEPEKTPIHEDDKKQPINPYGLSKLIVEQILASYQTTHDLNWAAFRYFNAAGAYKGRAMDYPVMTHLIPHAVESLITDKPFKLYGDDYPTKDGTCIRDFVHVLDIAAAHVTAAKRMIGGDKLQTAMNLGSGSGYSVLQVIKMLEKISGKKVNYHVEPRRAGDPAVLVADRSRAQKMLDWQLQYTLENMVTSHWQWRTAQR